MDEGAVASDSAQQKLLTLKQYLTDKEPLVAFSGGVDSTFLTFVAASACKRYLAVTMASPLTPSWEREDAENLAEQLGFRHRIVEFNPLEDPEVARNSSDRCYRCKKRMMTKLLTVARAEGLFPVMEGTNHDDLGSHRPGLKALEELGIVSPLSKFGLSKAEIVRLSRELGLPTWRKPPNTCLATRIPYGEALKRERLLRIDSAERCLRREGLTVVRVRDHGDLARIEIGEDELAGLEVERFRRRAARCLKELGYIYVSLDLTPYRPGSWDEPSDQHG